MIRWSERFALGDVQLDSQHKTLFALISQLEDHIPSIHPLQVRHWHAGTSIILKNLMDYADYHFRAEEEFLESKGFHKLNEHRSCHVQYTQYVNKTIHEICRSHDLNQLDMLYRYLKSWWINHVLSEDQHIKPLTGNHPNDNESGVSATP